VLDTIAGGDMDTKGGRLMDKEKGKMKNGLTM